MKKKHWKISLKQGLKKSYEQIWSEKKLFSCQLIPFKKSFSSNFAEKRTPDIWLKNLKWIKEDIQVSSGE